MGDWEDDWDDSWGRDDTPVLTSASGFEQTKDDTDIGWGERTWSEVSVSGAADSDDLERFLRDRPPHHGD
jgi:hypothetical protein